MEEQHLNLTGKEVIAGLNVHPAARAFPMMDDEALYALADSIKVNGLKEQLKVWTTSDGESWFIDGRNRATALEFLELDPADYLQQIPLKDETEVVQYILAKNLHRRHLTVAQRGLMGGRLLLTIRQAKKEGVEETWIPEGERPRDHIGKHLNVSGSTIQHGMTVLRDAEIEERVNNGEMKLSRAAKLVTERERDKVRRDERNEPTQASLAPDIADADHPLYDRRNESYTPETLISLARLVIGGPFDLDVASCAVANEIIQAKKLYTLHNDGLDLPWNGKIWCNPPFIKTGPKTGMTHWVEKFNDEHELGNMTEGFLVCNANVATKWFQKLWGFHVCLPPTRIVFDGPGGGKDPRHDNAVIYVGPNPIRFRQIFEHYGRVIKPVGARVLGLIGTPGPTEEKDLAPIVTP